jgi:protease I
MQNSPTILSGKRVAMVATDGVEQSELLEPKRALEAAGARVEVLSPKPGSIRGWNHSDWGQTIPVDRTVDSVNARDYDSLVLPGGVMNPDHLRRNPAVIKLVRDFFQQEKPVGAICHGPWTLIEAEVVGGRRMTSYESIQTDLKNAGAQWVDEPVVVDRGLVTSRKPADIPQFNQKLIEEIHEGIHQRT